MKFAVTRMHIAAGLDVPVDHSTKFTTIPNPRKRVAPGKNRAAKRKQRKEIQAQIRKAAKSGK